MISNVENTISFQRLFFTPRIDKEFIIDKWNLSFCLSLRGETFQLRKISNSCDCFSHISLCELVKNMREGEKHGIIFEYLMTIQQGHLGIVRVSSNGRTVTSNQTSLVKGVFFFYFHPVFSCLTIEFFWQMFELMSFVKGHDTESS